MRSPPGGWLEAHGGDPLNTSDGTFAYRPALDGLRSVAVYLVLVFHAGWSVFESGFVGVDLFFVLSGFLVTNVLLDDVDQHGRVRLWRFYARRMRRLLPASAVVIVVTAFVAVAVAAVTERLDLIADARAAALYVANWHFIAEATDYFAADDVASPYLHFWSLAIEEQFYLVFPIVLMGLVALDRRRTGALLGGVMALTALGAAAQLVWAGRDEVRAYYGTDARVYQLLLGVLIALVMRRAASTTGRERGIALGTTEVGLVFLVVVATPIVDVAPWARGFLAALASCLVLVGLERRRRGPAHWLLARPTMVRLGRISYGTYLWHWPVIYALTRLLDLSPPVLTAVAAVTATALAALSALVVEDPLRRSPRLDPRPRAVVATGLAVSVLVAGVSPVILRRDAAPAIAAVAADASTIVPDEAGRYGQVPDDVDWAKVSRSVLPGVPACDPRAPETCEVVDGGGDRVLVVGDSHAHMMLAAVEEQAVVEGDSVSVLIESACTWAEGLGRNDLATERCGVIRDEWTSWVVERFAPSRVVLVQRDPAPILDRYVTPDGADPARHVEDRMRATLEALSAAGLDVRVVLPTPESRLNPVNCLSASRDVAACAWRVPTPESWSHAAIRRAADGLEGVTVVDLDRSVCPELPVCVPYYDGRFVMRDTHHVQPAWWVHKGDDVRTALWGRPTGAS